MYFTKPDRWQRLSVSSRHEEVGRNLTPHFPLELGAKGMKDKRRAEKQPRPGVSPALPRDLRPTEGRAREEGAQQGPGHARVLQSTGYMDIETGGVSVVLTTCDQDPTRVQVQVPSAPLAIQLLAAGLGAGVPASMWETHKKLLAMLSFEEGTSSNSPCLLTFQYVDQMREKACATGGTQEPDGLSRASPNSSRGGGQGQGENSGVGQGCPQLHPHLAPTAPAPCPCSTRPGSPVGPPVDCRQGSEGPSILAGTPGVSWWEFSP